MIAWSQWRIPRRGIEYECSDAKVHHHRRPGAGKTEILRRLELDGFSVVEEAATDVITAAHAQGIDEPWKHPSFIDAVAGLQRERQMRAGSPAGGVQFHDRCAGVYGSLWRFIWESGSPLLAGELERIKQEVIYENRVFFIRNLGFVTPTEARRISFEETLRFEKIHEETYRDFGFELVMVEEGSVAERVRVIKAESTECRLKYFQSIALIDHPMLKLVPCRNAGFLSLSRWSAR